jgi:phosphatidylglycerophosphatase A
MEKQAGHQKLIKIIASSLGLGYIPWFPGTWTSLVVIIVFWFWNPQGNVWTIFTLVAILVAMMVANSAEKYFHNKDDQKITIDEVAGMAIALLFIPHNAWLIILAFILFRIFDISKIFPLRKIEKQPGAWGLVGDDVVAGIYTHLIMYFIIYLIK